ncbi:ABC transporter permease [Ectobacillus sp. JY-23]|uniref:ABC transporter permease n=1 Tax=Ectobacillus sp. JY-23 TaxID=2933872 RepID=UPI001FF29BFF|nr:ABC transporter permease [Ectobacillus sp. JY-23]UOY92063.1 ABC transporter permease [Ectobacillus sp. JY-23]
MNTNELWKQRFTLFLANIRTYSRYIFNDHISIALVFGLGLGTYYYREWLHTLSPDFPAAFIIALVLSLVLTAGSVQTLFKPADLVFLLQVEEKLGIYIQKAFRYSYVMQLYVLSLFFAVFAPLYTKTLGNVQSYLVLLLLAVLAKLWNLMGYWKSSFDMNHNVRRFDRVIRFFFNFLLMFFAAVHDSIFIVGAIVATMVLYLLLLQRKQKGKGLHWEYLIEEENRRMLLFYRIANMFTDVPALKEQVRRRPWLDFVANMVPFQQRSTYTFLYTRTFLRSGNYLGIYVRLLSLGAILVYIVPSLYGRMLLSGLFLYLLGYQALSLWRQHSLKLWVGLYPVPEVMKKQSFLRVLFILLLVAATVLIIVFAISTKHWIMTGALTIGNIAVALWFTYIYGKRKIQR